MTDNGENNNRVKKKYNRIAPVYNYLEFFMEIKISRWRERLWKKISKTVNDDVKLLEVGVGTGKNISYYPDNIDIHAIDFR